MLFKLSILKLPSSSSTELSKRSLLLDKELFIVGRSDTCDLVLFDEHRLISREHFSLRKQGGNWLLTVISSVNSVQINDRDVASNESHLLIEGEHIFLGAYELLFERAIDDNRTQFAPMEVAKNKEKFPFEEFDNKPISESHDPFDFINDIGSNVADIPTIESASVGVVDVFGLDTTAPDPWQDIRETKHSESNPFDLMGTNIAEGYEKSTKQSSHELMSEDVVDIFGLSNNNYTAKEVNQKDSSYDHAHPINESINNILPIIKEQENSLPSIVSDTKKLLIDALGLDYERFVNIDEKELIQRVGFLLSNSLNLIVDLLRLRSVTKLEVGTAATTLTINHNNPLKYSPNSVVALGYLLGKPQIGFMSYQEAIKATKEDLVSYNKDLLNVTQKLGKHILQELSPVTIESSLESKGGFALKIPVQREAKLWTEYKKLHETCDANLDQIIKKVF